VEKKIQSVLLLSGAFVVVCLSLLCTILLVPNIPSIRWVLLPELGLMFGCVYLFLRSLRKQLPSPTQYQREKAVHVTRRLAWFFVVVPAIGFLARWRELTALPYGLGFAFPIAPMLLGVYYFCPSNRVSRSS